MHCAGELVLDDDELGGGGRLSGCDHHAIHISLLASMWPSRIIRWTEGMMHRALHRGEEWHRIGYTLIDTSHWES